jgi:predicted Zn-dependent peptidase
MPAIRTITLACGMPLILEPMTGVRSVGLTWLIPAGSATEPEDRLGLSAMWSELLMRGAGELGSREQADAWDRIGASRSADASTMQLRIGCTTVGTRLHEALPLAADMVLRPRFDEASIDPSRDLALQAIESLKDDPQERAVIAAKELHAHPPMNRSGLGTVEGLEAISREDVAGGWAARARPVGAILSIAGDADVFGGSGGDAIARTMDALLAGWSGEAPAVRVGKSTTRGGYRHFDDPSSQVQIVAMHEAPAEREPDSRLERVVSSVLSGGMSARLFTEVREKRALCYSVSQSYAADRDFGRVMAYVGTTPERSQESLDVLMAELARISTPAGAVTEQEFERALTGIRAGIVLSGESTGARAAALASDYYRLGRARSLEEIATQYASITLNEVNRYLERRTLGEVTIVTLGAKELVRPR